MANENNPADKQPASPPSGPQPAQPAQPAQSAQPAQPTQPAQPVQPAQPAKPAQPVQSAQPAASPPSGPKPVTPQPAQPAQPAPAAKPGGPATKPPAPATPTAKPQVPAKPGRPVQPAKPGAKPGTTRKPPNPKKLIFGCIGCSGFSVLAFVVFVLIFVSQTTPSGENAMARSLGVSTGSFINTLIQLVNLLFGALSILLLILATVGLFRLFMARKDDKETRKKGLKLAGVSGLLLFFSVMIWVGVYMYMSSRRVPIEVSQVSGIVTEPEDTLRLTAPITITFDSSNIQLSRNHEILSYLWDFGDGTQSTNATTTHTYEEMGENQGRFDVQLQITKRDVNTGEELVDTHTRTVTIANIALSARFSADPEKGPAPLTVDFDASDSAAPAGNIVSYEWDFDNNNTFSDDSGVEVTHEFDQVGTYQVNLRVTDNNGNFEVTSQDIVVEGANVPTAVIEIPTDNGKYFVSKQYTFEGEKSSSPNGKVEKYEWDFGDGSPKASTRTATHIYKNEGDYEVILTVTDEEGKEAEASEKIKVEVPEAAPIAVIKTVPAPQGDDDFISSSVPFEVSFDGRDSQDADDNIVDYKWDFDGDDVYDDSGETVTYVFKKAGTYNAKLTVIDAEDNESNAIIVVKAGEQPLTARVKADQLEGVTPLTVTFDASSSSYPSGEIVSYKWDFGDGSPERIDASSVTYKYTKIGTFTATVTTIASDNTKDTTEIAINVRPIPLTACFEATPESGEAPLTVEFDSRCASGTIASYSWDFGDTKSSKQRKPSHEFTSPGSYTVTLEVADNQNVLDTFTKNILVTGSI